MMCDDAVIDLGFLCHVAKSGLGQSLLQYEALPALKGLDPLPRRDYLTEVPFFLLCNPLILLL